MNNYQIITDATCDMNQEILDQKDILVMPMEIVMDDGQIFQHTLTSGIFQRMTFMKS